MVSKSDTRWFFASEYNAVRSCGESPPQTLRQPWRAFWPPKSGPELLNWMESEYPEVLSWQFDHTKPFDRPWRTWTRSARAKKESEVKTLQIDANSSPATSTANKSFSDEISTLPNAQNPPPETPTDDADIHKTQSLISDLDQQIKALNLSSVTPASFHYLAPLPLYNFEKPYLSRLPCTTDLKRTNIAATRHEIPIYEISGHENSFNLDGSGFEFVKSPISTQEWTTSSVRSEYLPALRDWLRKHLQCTDVIVYAYNFRGDVGERPIEEPWKAPFLRAHCDATSSSCLRRLRLYLPNDFASFTDSRIRFLNIWRPISTPVQDSPLAICDFRTVDSTDLIETDIIFPHYCDEAYEVIHNPRHRWFYKKNMHWDDVIIFKLDDSDQDTAKFCPHSAFMDPSIPPGTPKRASIEVRVIAIG